MKTLPSRGSTEYPLGHANWNAIAAAIAAVYFALGEPKAVSTDMESLRAAIEEFQTHNPRIYATLKIGRKQ